MQLLGGKIKLESWENKGAQFYFDLSFKTCKSPDFLTLYPPYRDETNFITPLQIKPESPLSYIPSILLIEDNSVALK